MGAPHGNVLCVCTDMAPLHRSDMSSARNNSTNFPRSGYNLGKGNLSQQNVWTIPQTRI